jgi:hypothetical protein
MKLFPHKIVMVELSDNRATTLNVLRHNTKLTDVLGSYYTDKDFIGQVDDAGFKIISSEVGRGAVCVFVGDLQDSIGRIEIRIHNAFKMMFSILMLMPIVVLAISIANEGIRESAGLIFVTLMTIVLLRFVFIEFSFRFISRTGLNKLSKITGIKELDENE